MNKIKTAVATASLLVTVGLTTVTPAQAADNVCSSPLLGGSFYCGGAYGNGEAIMMRGSDAADFVIGLDHAVWWRTINSPWASLGGYLTSQVKFTHTQNTPAPYFTINATGSDGRTWSRDFTRRGFEGDWYAAAASK